MYCSNCEKEIQKEASFCSSCGSQVGNFDKVGNIQSSKEDITTPVKKEGTAYVILGWIFFAISLLFIPILFGAGTFIMGFLTYRVRSQTHGVILMVFGVVGAILGAMLGAALGGS